MRCHIGSPAQLTNYGTLCKLGFSRDILKSARSFYNVWRAGHNGHHQIGVRVVTSNDFEEKGSIRTVNVLDETNLFGRN